MKPALKVGIVVAGYAAAILIACAAVAIHVATTSGPDAQASGGMYAAGDAFLFIAVFGVCALVPTGAALIFLRSYRRFWVVFSALSLGVAITGASAAVLYAAGRTAVNSPLATWASFSVLRILLAPLFGLAFLLASFFAPGRTFRKLLLAATAIEGAAFASVAFLWLSSVRTP